MSEKQKMCTVVDLPTSILASLFAALMFAGFHNQFPLITMSKTIILNEAQKAPLSRLERGFRLWRQTHFSKLWQHADPIQTATNFKLNAARPKQNTLPANSTKFRNGVVSF